jgi:hypothetical protein
LPGVRRIKYKRKKRDDMIISSSLYVPSEPTISPFKLVMLMFKDKCNIVIKILHQDESLREKYFYKLHSRAKYNAGLPEGARGYSTSNFTMELARTPNMRIVVKREPCIVWRAGSHYLHIRGKDYSKDGALIYYYSGRAATTTRVERKIKACVRKLNNNAHKGTPVRLLL